MVNKINPSDDNKRIPPKSQDLSFHQDYTTPQQKVMNEHISELKNLLKHADANNPEIQQRIAQLRHQIQYEDLPAAGLSERRKPTISDALQYIDQQSGYSAYQEKQAALEATFGAKKSKKSGWRQLAGSAPTSVSMSKTKTKLGAQDTDLSALENTINTWKSQHSGKIDTQCTAICTIIDQIKAKTGTPCKVDADGVRSLIQLSHDPNVNVLFNTNIYQQISKTDLGNFFDAIGLDKSLLPAETKPSTPPFKPGYVAYVLKNLPDTNNGAETTIQVAGNMDNMPAYISGFRSDGTPLVTHIIDFKPNGSSIGASKGANGQDPSLLEKHTLPTFTDSDGKKQSFVYIPAGMSSGRIYYNGTQNTYNTGFSEFTVDSNGVPYTNFTAVDGIPSLTSNVQMTGKTMDSNRNGIQTDFTTFAAKMKSLYNKYDTTGVWANNMIAQDSTVVPKGSILSGKDMTNPAITGALSSYLSNTFMTQMVGQRIYFLADGLPNQSPKVQSGMITKVGDGYQFTFDGASTSPLPLPKLDGINQWISGAFGAPTDTDDAATGAEKWGAAKALSSIINKGILPSDIIGKTSTTNPIQGSYFTDPKNIQNFYQAPFYNIYLRAMHEAGCSAYGADFDDYMGGDGTVSDIPSDEPCVTITFNTTGPTPPAFDANAIADQLFDPKNDPTIAKEWKGENIVSIMNTKTDALNTAITNYQSSPTTDNWTKLQAVYTDYQSSMPNLQKQATSLASDMLNYEHGSELNAVVKAVTGQDATPAQLAAVANAMATHEVDQAQPMPGPPGPPSFDPNKAVSDIKQHPQGRNIVGDYINYAQTSQAALVTYKNDLAKYDSLTDPQAKLNYYKTTLTDAHSNLQQACAAMSGYAGMLLFDNRNDVQAVLQKYGDIKPTDPFTDAEMDAMTKTMESLYLPTVPDMPLPPTPGFDPQKATNEIYGNAQLQFHNQFMNLPVVQEIATYQANVATYNKTPSTGLYATLQTESKQIAIDLPGLKGAVTGLLNTPANQKIIKSIPDLANLSPDEIASLATYISGTKEAAAVNVPPLPPAPPLNPAQQYLKTLDDWLTAKNDKGSGDGIFQELEQPLSAAIQNNKFTTVADIQNWLKNSAAGQQAMKYLTSPTIYAKDPALAALPAGPAQSAALQDLFNKLQITAPVPTPPAPPPSDDMTKLFGAYAKTSMDFAAPNGIYTQQLIQLNGMKNVTGSNIAKFMQQQYLNYVNKLTDLQQHVTTPPFPFAASDIPRLATEMAQKEWTAAGRTDPFPLTPQPPTNPAQQYLQALDGWLTSHNDKGSGDGIFQELEQPLSAAIQSGGFTTVADIQNWLKNSAAGQQAMKYLTTATIYAKDPALAALPAGPAQSAALQDLFNKLQITAPVPTPPGPPPSDDLAKLFGAYANTPMDFKAPNGMYTQQLSQLKGIKGDVSASYMTLHMNNFMSKLQDLQKNVKTPPFPFAASDIPRLAWEMCKQEWSDAGRTPSSFPLPTPPTR